MKNTLLKNSLLSITAISALSTPITAATLHVTTTDDDINGSLREAITQSVNGDNIIFDLNGTFEIGSYLLIDKNITITGNGISSTIIDANSNTLFSVNSGHSLSISKMTIGGSDNNVVLNNFGTVNVNDVNITGETIGSYSGGRIYNGGTMSISKSFISNNSAPDGQSGGAIKNLGTLNITESEISNNSVNCGSDSGGAIYNQGSLTIEKSSLYNNRANSNNGGAIYNTGSGKIDIENSTFFANSAVNGGAIGSFGTNASSEINISHSTIHSNTATNAGGGLTHDDAETYNLKNNIIYDNTAPTGPNLALNFTSWGYNLIGDTNDAMLNGNTTGNIINSNPQVGTYDYHGGTVKTLNIAYSDSPAIGNGICTNISSNLVTTDQRSISRPSTNCTIGAFEFVDTDEDTVENAADKFPNDIAASIDADGDGYPASWNSGKTKADSTTGLQLDLDDSDSSITIPKFRLKAHGGALQFDTGVDPLDINLSSMAGATSYTIEAWMNLSNYDESGYGNPFFGGTTTPYDFKLGFEPSNGLNFNIANGATGGSKCLPGTNAYTPNTWQHVAIVKDNLVQKIYINGEEKCTQTATNNVALGNGGLHIYSPNGVMDELRIWNIARSGTDINTSKNTQLDGNETGLVAYYNFDERSGNTIYDITSNNNDLTKDNGMTRLNFLGKLPKFSSDSASDISASHSSAYNQTTFSFSLWFNPEVLSGDLFSSYDSDYYKGYKLFFQNGALAFGMANGISLNPIITTSPTSTIRNQWNYVVVTYDGNNVVMELNGVTETSTYNSSEFTLNDTVGPVFGNSFSGQIADVTIWKKALTTQEKEKIKYGSIDTSDADLAGYWPLIENSLKDFSSGGNDASGYNITESNSSAVLYGDTLYSTVDTIAKAQLIPEDFSVGTPTITLSNPTSVVSFSNLTNILTYSPTDLTTYTLNFSAADANHTIALNLNLKSYMKTYSTTLNLTNDVDTSEHNITNIFIVNYDDFNGTINTSNSVGVANFSSNYLEGTRSFSESINYANYMIVFETDGGTQTQSYWYYNNDGKIYSQTDYNDRSSSEFKISYTTTSSNINPTSQNWIDSSKIQVIDDPNIVLFYPLEETTTSYDTSYAKSFSSLGINSFYQIYQSYDATSESKLINIEKTLIDNSEAYEVSMSIAPQPSTMVKETNSKLNSFDTSSNIISLDDNGTTMAQMYLYKELSDSELSSRFSLYNDYSISFNTNSKGYEFYKKQLQNECIIEASSPLVSGTTLADIEAIRALFKTNSSTSSGSDKNILIYNKYNSTKGIQLAQTGTSIFEADTSANTTSSSAIGTYSDITTGISCKKDGVNFSSDSIITFDTSTAGYEHAALIKYNGNYYKGKYIPANTTTTEIYLNKEATQSIATTLNMSSSQLHYNYNTEFDWTYLSLPTNLTLCTNDFQALCSHSQSIEDIFGTESSTKPITVFKYRGGYWSYYTTEDKIYNIDKLTSINHTDGLLIYSENKKTLSLPYNIYDLSVDTFKLYKQTGWHLVGNQLKRTPSNLENNVTTQELSLKYIMKQESYNNNTSTSWKVSAPNNDEYVDSSIGRIDNLAPVEALWIYVE